MGVTTFQDKIPLDFTPIIGYIPTTPPNWGPAHDGELGRGGGQACGWRLTCSPLPGAEGGTLGHYDPSAFRQREGRRTAIVSTLLGQPIPCRMRALLSAPIASLTSWHTAPGSARASHFLREGQMQPSSRMTRAGTPAPRRPFPAIATRGGFHATG